MSTTFIEPSVNGVVADPQKIKKPRVSIRSRKKVCKICDKSFVKLHGLAVHTRRMHHGKPESSTVQTRTSANFRYERIKTKWMKKASTEKDPKVSATIFECLLDLSVEFQ